MKPKLEDVIHIYRLKQHITNAFNEIDRMTVEFLEDYGEGQFDYDLEEGPEILDLDSTRIPHVNELIREGGRYLRFELTDNMLKLASGQPVYTQTAIKPVHYAIRSLKREPKSLSQDQ